MTHIQHMTIWTGRHDVWVVYPEESQFIRCFQEHGYKHTSELHC